MAKDCRSLARFDLKGIPPMVAGLPRIEVKFLIDANGILHVSAREQRSGKEAEVEVKPTYGLTDEQVETMILDSFDHAETDIQERQSIEPAIEQSVHNLRTLIDERRIELELNLPPRLPEVAMDAGRIVQVLTNLLSNAIKFSLLGS